MMLRGVDPTCGTVKPSSEAESSGTMGGGMGKHGEQGQWNDGRSLIGTSDVSDALAAYPLVTRTLLVGGRQWQITAVEDQDALMRRVQDEADLANFPYGLMLWPSAIGLAQALSEQASMLSGARGAGDRLRYRTGGA